MVTSSSDVPMKGLVPLLEAVAKLRTERDVELTVIGRPTEGGRVDRAIARLGLSDAVRCVSGISDDELAHLYGEAQVAVVPSLYEGFSLPAIEAMSCGVARGGDDRRAPSPRSWAPTGRPACSCRPTTPARSPGPSPACSTTRRSGPGSGPPGRERVVSRFTWQVTAAGTAACYQAVLEGSRSPVRRRPPWEPASARARSGLMLTVDYDRLGVGPGDLVLDLGCGFGRHAFEAARRGASVVALDAGPEEVAQVRGTFGAMIEAGELDAGPPGRPRCRATRCALPFADGTFDRVIASEVLEHIPDDTAAMRELARVLRPGGAMAVTVPRCGPEAVNWALSDEYHDTPGGHVRIYRRSTLERRLGAAGLVPTGSPPRARPALALLVAALPGRARRTTRIPAVEAYHKVLVWDIVKAPFLTRTADRVLSPLIGKSLVLYLTKPDAASSELPDARPNLPRGVPGRRGPTTPTQGAAA